MLHLATRNANHALVELLIKNGISCEILNNQQKIVKMVGTSSTSYQTKIASRHSIGKINCVSESDDCEKNNDGFGSSKPTAYVNRRRMGIRPGGLGTAGKNAAGCEIKHGSYDRVLARRRGPLIS